MLKLYYAPDNASLVLRLALEEIGAAYETVLVDRARQAQKSPDYLALNPAGLIPTLVTPHGAISETGACLLWLCEAYPSAELALATTGDDRARFLRWLFYLSNTVHADLTRIFYPDRFVPMAAITDHHAVMTGNLKRHFGILNAASLDEPQLFRAGSALAMYLCPLMRWSALYPVTGERWFDLDVYPNLKDIAVSMETRRSAKAAAAAEGLGATPFSRPDLPTPPEGSAT